MIEYNVNVIHKEGFAFCLNCVFSHFDSEQQNTDVLALTDVEPQEGMFRLKSPKRNSLENLFFKRFVMI